MFDPFPGHHLPRQLRNLSPREDHVARHAGSEAAVAHVGDDICLAVAIRQGGRGAMTYTAVNGQKLTLKNHQLLVETCGN